MLPNDYILIAISTQTLTLFKDENPAQKFSISTASNGAGEESGSEQTPRGWHTVRAKIGAGCAIGTVFSGRRPTGEIYSPELAKADSNRDWILTRILWLCGTEPGINRLGDVDSMRRYIYIHGTPDSEPMGEPHSHGCIRMRNDELITLFNQVPAGLAVKIEA